MGEAIKNRYDFVVLFDVENGNPNGDPDAGNMPRIDPETGYGLVTDVCLKRKIRNYVETLKEDTTGYKIYIKDNVPLNRSDLGAFQSLGIDEKEIKNLKKTDPMLDVKVRDFMCQNFYDIRTFGAVMTTFVKANLNCGQVRGPVQMGFAKSVDPILPQEITITRVAITTEEDAAKKGTEMGRKYIVPYGLYRVEGYVSANSSKIKGVILQIGINDIGERYNISNTKTLIKKLSKKYSNKTIYVHRLFPIGTKYKFGNKYTTQKQIKSYNASIKSYCSTLKNVKYIDATSGFINSNGYLKYQDPEGTHISWQYLGKYYNNIEAAVNRVR